MILLIFIITVLSLIAGVSVWKLSAELLTTQRKDRIKRRNLRIVAAIPFLNIAILLIWTVIYFLQTVITEILHLVKYGWTSIKNEFKVSTNWRELDVFKTSVELSPNIPKGTKGVILEIYDDKKIEVEFVDKDGKNIMYKGESTFIININEISLK